MRHSHLFLQIRATTPSARLPPVATNSFLVAQLTNPMVAAKTIGASAAAWRSFIVNLH